ncbi:ATP-binding protein [Nocardia sp. NPDC020380]|uniref:ATP-binding protein n=1 Tax=Nocardia sp. NPDC020380 TaxID=3364309 RepID=UPI0037A5E03F
MRSRISQTLSTRCWNGWTALSTPFEVDGLLEPFRRLAAAQRPANPARCAGLGLSIVRSVAHAHAGEVRAVARPEGGLTVTVTVPLDIRQ